jgi:hypothetical protein
MVDGSFCTYYSAKLKGFNMHLDVDVDVDVVNRFLGIPLAILALDDVSLLHKNQHVSYVN